MKWRLLLTILGCFSAFPAVFSSECDVPGSPQDFWPPIPVYTNTAFVAQKIAESKALGDWRKMTEAGPYVRGGNYLNWSGAHKDTSRLSTTTNDANGVIMLSYDKRATFVYNPVTICLYSLYLHSAHKRGAALSPRFKANADHLLQMQGEDGAIRYMYELPSRPVGWVSGMAQGMALSVWTRAYKIYGDPKYLQACSNSFRFLRRDPAQGGVTGNLSDLHPSLHRFKMIQEFPFSPEAYTFNGSVFALLGVYDWAEYDSEADCFFEQCLETIRWILPYYDMGGISAYDLRHLSQNRPAGIAADYHHTNTILTWALDSIRPHPVLNQRWRTWAAYLGQPLPDTNPMGITMAESGGLTLRWSANAPAILEKSDGLDGSQWERVTLSPGQRVLHLGADEPASFFRMRD